MTIYDAVPLGLQALDQPLYLSLALSALTALVFAAFTFGFLRLIEHAQQRLTQAARLATAGTLAASIAHDVRNPLAIILSTTQVLREAPNLTGDQRELLHDIEAEIRRADEQLNAFLDLSREVPLRTEPCDVAATVGATIELLRFQARQLGVQLEFTAPPPSDRLIAALDRRRFRQALLNVVINALDALAERDAANSGVESKPPPTIRVEVAAGPNPRPQALEARVALICVTDNGPGIPPVVLKRIFEPFFSTKSDGTGLGLKIAQQITQRHGGRLVLSSVVGVGTTVRFEIPAEVPNPAAPAP